MKKVKDKTINLMVDTFDEATMLCYYGMIDEEKENTDVTDFNKERGRLNYYECLFNIIDYFLNGKTLKVDSDVQDKIDKLLDKFLDYTNENKINQEEIRKALLLLDIKAFKNINFSLDLITPDFIGILMANIINSVYKEKNLELLDVNFGTGNLAFTISNHVRKNLRIIGLDNHMLLSNLATYKANMFDINLNMYYEDALGLIVPDVDLIVSDLAIYDYENKEYHSSLYDKGVKYFPYLIIEHNLKIKKKILSFYVIENTFFQKEHNKEFYDMIKQSGHIDALIVLPDDIFVSSSVAKSILVVSNDNTNQNDTHIYMLPTTKNQQQFMNKLEEICEYLKIRKEELK